MKAAAHAGPSRAFVRRIALGAVRPTAPPDFGREAPTGGVMKRCFDIAVAGTALAFLWPLIVLLALAVALQDGGPAFYGHRRVGRNGTPFRCLKLRTMVPDGDAVLARHLCENPAAAEEWRETQKLRHDPRVTMLGRLLRKSSLDELPQLINVLRGEMSIVGPRPVVENELERYGEFRAIYLAVRPGVTGPWQISGRNDVTYAERVVLDVIYVGAWSLPRDVAIMTRTIPAVVRARGTS